MHESSYLTYHRKKERKKGKFLLSYIALQPIFDISLKEMIVLASSLLCQVSCRSRAAGGRNRGVYNELFPSFICINNDASQSHPGTQKCYFLSQNATHSCGFLLGLSIFSTTLIFYAACVSD